MVNSPFFCFLTQCKYYSMTGFLLHSWSAFITLLMLGFANRLSVLESFFPVPVLWKQWRCDLSWWVILVPLSALLPNCCGAAIKPASVLRQGELVRLGTELRLNLDVCLLPVFDTDWHAASHVSTEVSRLEMNKSCQSAAAGSDTVRLTT